jgi:hypothetical protein
MEQRLEKYTFHSIVIEQMAVPTIWLDARDAAYRPPDGCQGGLPAGAAGVGRELNKKPPIWCPVRSGALLIQLGRIAKLE